MVELVHNSGPMMNKVVFGKEIRCLKDKTMGQYGLNNGDVPDSVLGFCNRQQVIAHFKFRTLLNLPVNKVLVNKFTKEVTNSLKMELCE